MMYRKLNIEDIKPNEWYKLPEIGLMLNVHKSTLMRRCKSGKIIASNIGTDKRAIYVILGSNLLKYLNK